MKISWFSWFRENFREIFEIIPKWDPKSCPEHSRPWKWNWNEIGMKNNVYYYFDAWILVKFFVISRKFSWFRDFFRICPGAPKLILQLLKLGRAPQHVNFILRKPSVHSYGLWRCYGWSDFLLGPQGWIMRIFTKSRTESRNHELNLGLQSTSNTWFCA